MKKPSAQKPELRSRFRARIALLGGILLCAGSITYWQTKVGAAQLPRLQVQNTAGSQAPEQPRTLALGQAVERELAGGAIHAYQVSLTAGQFLRTTVMQKGVDVVVRVYQPDGGKVIEVDSPNGTIGPEPVAIIANTTGMYRLSVRSLDKDAGPGRYEIKINELRAGNEEDQIRIKAQQLFAEADELQNRGTKDSLRQAIDKAQAAIPLWHTLEEQSLEAQTLNKIGYIYYLLAEYEKSLAVLQQALPLRRAVHDADGEADTLTNIGAVYKDTGRLPQSIESYERAKALYQKAHDRSGEATVINNLGGVYASMGETQKALDYYQRAFATRKEIGDRAGQANTLNNLASIYDRLGDHPKAIDSYDQALAIWLGLNDKRNEAVVLNNICRLYQDKGEYVKALDYCNRSLPLRRTTGDRRGEAATLATMGQIYHLLGEPQKALDSYEEALHLRQVIKDVRGEANTLNSMGTLYGAIGEPLRARDHYNRALPLRRAVSDRQGEASTLTNIGAIYYDTNDKQKALDYFNQALVIWRAIQDRIGEAKALGNLGKYYLSQRDHTKAAELLNQTLLLSRASGDRLSEVASLAYLGDVYTATGEAEKALDSYNQALTLSRTLATPQIEASTLYGLAVFQRDRGQLNEARAQIEAALKIVESQRLKLASISLRASYLASVQRFYEFYIDLLIRLQEKNAQPGYAAMALEVSERARARSLLELLIEARADIREGVDANLLARDRELQQQLSARTDARIRLLGGKHSVQQAEAATSEIEALNAEQQQLEAQIRTKSPRYAALVQPQPLNLGEIQTKVLDYETILLEYALGPQRSFLWVASRDDLSLFILPKREVIEGAARKLYKSLTAAATMGQGTNAAPASKQAGDWRADATALTQMLLAPAAAKLSGGKRLVIVADGAVQYVPFAALPDPNVPARKSRTSRSSAPDYQPLIVNHEIVSSPSASTISVLRAESPGRQPRAKTVAVIADPVFEATDLRVKQANTIGAVTAKPDSKSVSALRSLVETLNAPGAFESGKPIPRLPYSRREALSIVGLVPETQRMLALDFEADYATAASTQLGEYRFVHFATHGLLNSTQPELSGILLSLVDQAGKSQPQGLLRLGEIYNLKLPVELVVLSGCQTALGQEVRGEGLVGLTRGFMYAGAPRVVASLWKVDDAATADLMKAFYQGMLGPQRLPAAAALRQAQKQMWQRNKERSPFYWAAFVLQGEWR